MECVPARDYLPEKQQTIGRRPVPAEQVHRIVNQRFWSEEHSGRYSTDPGERNVGRTVHWKTCQEGGGC
jgi:hypothetical protein